MLPELSRTALHPFPHTALAKPYESLAAPRPHTASTEKNSVLSIRHGPAHADIAICIPGPAPGMAFLGKPFEETRLGALA